jgi:phosphatidate cytidylyltransferase
MTQVVLYIIVIYFIIGGAGVVAINRKATPDAARERWIKYFVYLFIVSVVAWSTQYARAFMTLSLLILAVGLYEMYDVWKKHHRKPIGFFITSILFYLLLSFCFLNYASSDSATDKLFLYTLVFTFDGFAQIIGQLFGRKKIFAISPNKTLEGLFGGFITGITTGILLVTQSGNKLSLALVSLILIITSAAMAGDLLASWYKRKCGVKDFSKLIPGHGGFLDRFDSFIFAGAIFWCCQFFLFK